LREVTGIAYVYLLPLLVVSDKNIRAPIRVFAGENLVVVYSEFTLPQLGLVQLVKILANYLRRKGVNHVILLPRYINSEQV